MNLGLSAGDLFWIRVALSVLAVLQVAAFAWCFSRWSKLGIRKGENFVRYVIKNPKEWVLAFALSIFFGYGVAIAGFVAFRRIQEMLGHKDPYSLTVFGLGDVISIGIILVTLQKAKKMAMVEK